ncbi:MAG: hypothetical protein CMF39_00640 [Legionellaceae bacterium]|nr:hypothetical protein [Legionellaceae bacterium]|tara:strand:- start:292 stop:654 length:363 start_codon:yes stop_codon:yes gene_type:complete
MTNRSKSILLLVDPHKSVHEVLLHARQLCARGDVKLHLIHVVHPTRSPGLHYRLRKDERDLQRLIKLYDLSVVTMRVRVGAKDKVLVEEAGLLGADILTFPQRLPDQPAALLENFAVAPT